MTPLAIRPYQASDRAACRAVFYRAVHEGTAAYYSEAQRAGWAPDPLPNPEKPDRFLDQWAFVATRDGAIRGFMTMARDGYLDMAFVLPEEMRSGMAGALYDRLMEQARGAGLTRLTVRASIPSRNFLQKRGWRVEETRIFTDDGAPVENYLMALDPVPPLAAPATCPFNPATDGAQMSFDGRMSYGDYLRIDQILGAQHLLTGAHDEMLFIIQHQTSELWMRLALHEFDAARQAIAADRLRESFKMLARIARIFEQLNSAWDVLRTMTPADYTTFRDGLGQSSGFQSWQYRLVEYAVGNRNAAMLKPHAHRDDITARLQAELARPSLYDEALRALARMGFAIPQDVLERDLSRQWVENDAVRAIWTSIYREPVRHWEAYELAEKLVDFEDYFRRWRFNHVTTVERVIGLKRGTGGTSGVGYLRRMLEVELFPELWHLRTDL